MSTNPELGRAMYVRGLVVHGKMGAEDWQHFLRDMTDALGMKPVSRPGVWKYPVDGHSGGNGYTMLQPITESFLALDTWPDHDGAYLFICSCKAFSAQIVDKIVKKWGLAGGKAFSTSLGML